MKALIVEDCDELRFCLSLLLETEGYQIQAAKNGLSALNFLNTQKRPVDHF
jgi:CheY-like chemotaxis protein